MATPSSLTTLIGFGAQTVKGTYPITNIFTARGVSAESMPAFDYIENENTMLGVHERATAAQTIAERSSVQVPVDYELLLYPKTLAMLLFGVGFVPGTAVTASGISTHKLVKSNKGDAPYLTNYLAVASGAARFTRQIRDVRLSQVVLTLNRTTSSARATGMGLSESGIANAGITTIAEADTQFLPFLGGMIWDTTPVANGSTYNFGLPREHVITFDHPLEEDDQLLHNYSRNDNQELSFALSGAMRGFDFSLAYYNAMFYGNIGSIIGANLGVATVLTGLTMELNTSRNIPGASAPYKFIMNIPKAEVRVTNFRMAGNELVRADMQWKMIDDAATPPVRIELTNNVTSYPHSNTLFVAAGGTSWTLPDATP